MFVIRFDAGRIATLETLTLTGFSNGFETSIATHNSQEGGTEEGGTRQQSIFANGAPSESLYTGADALKSVSSAARAEIFAIFPELSNIDHTALSARDLVNGRKGR